ncbi:hypothetical protein H0G86_010852 [Trichoderma simmonsii]|uniref:Secreted protein n=1 Tax=Trichoderma simmonsii TaxID=1491479 RepID=A0A8G0PPD5_9HYPO|nr:hypothetical protein H0G86_010852 [Trichoderma simmonsii]
MGRTMLRLEFYFLLLAATLKMNWRTAQPASKRRHSKLSREPPSPWISALSASSGTANALQASICLPSCDEERHRLACAKYIDEQPDRSIFMPMCGLHRHALH